MKLSAMIKNALDKKNLTPSDLARMTGYTPQYIHEILSGKKRWNETTIDKTCDALGLEFKVMDKKSKEKEGVENVG